MEVLINHAQCKSRARSTQTACATTPLLGCTSLFEPNLLASDTLMVPGGLQQPQTLTAVELSETTHPVPPTEHVHATVCASSIPDIPPPPTPPPPPLRIPNHSC